MWLFPSLSVTLPAPVSPSLSPCLPRRFSLAPPATSSRCFFGRAGVSGRRSRPRSAALAPLDGVPLARVSFDIHPSHSERDEESPPVGADRRCAARPAHHPPPVSLIPDYLLTNLQSRISNLTLPNPKLPGPRFPGGLCWEYLVTTKCPLRRPS
jgi:hypothetical protein